MGLVEYAGRLGLGVAADPLGLGLGLGQDRVARPVGLTGDRHVLGLALGSRLGRDLPALAPDQVENGRTHLDRVIEPAEPDVQNLDSQLARRRGGNRGQ